MSGVLRVVAFAVGVVLVAATLLSAIKTVVLPRSEPAKLGRFVFRTVRFLVFEPLVHRAESYEDVDRIMARYAPVSLLVLPFMWAIGVITGFTNGVTCASDVRREPISAVPLLKPRDQLK